MSDLDSGIEPMALAKERLPEFAAHHGAKHRLLREYIQVWLPKLGYSYPQIAIVDCFASAGRYRSGETGSPLTMLNAYCGWNPSKRLQRPPHFVFIEKRREFAQHLRSEIGQLSDLRGAEVDVLHGRYEDAFPKVIDLLATKYRQPVPTFAFVDPKGWAENPFELIASFRDRIGEKAEALIYLPARFMARFAKEDFVRQSLEKLYGGPSLEEAIEKDDERGALSAAERLAEAYRQRLKADHFEWATRFRINPVRRNEYYLLFGSGDINGLREMKRAMWHVDPVGGQAYEQDALAAVGHRQLFSTAGVGALPSEERLIALLRAHFGQQKFRIEAAEEFTLTQTRYLDKPHLRRWALIPLQDAGELEILSGGRGRRGQFPPGTEMRIV
jgi:three-Cys-motif partner protein